MLPSEAAPCPGYLVRQVLPWEARWGTSLCPRPVSALFGAELRSLHWEIHGGTLFQSLGWVCVTKENKASRRLRRVVSLLRVVCRDERAWGAWTWFWRMSRSWPERDKGVWRRKKMPFSFLLKSLIEVLVWENVPRSLQFQVLIDSGCWLWYDPWLRALSRDQTEAAQWGESGLLGVTF